jgi:hypothetical protein
MQAAGAKGEYRRSARAKHLTAAGEELLEVWQHDDGAHYITYSQTMADWPGDAAGVQRRRDLRTGVRHHAQDGT